jgi:hypothetical protein
MTLTSEVHMVTIQLKVSAIFRQLKEEFSYAPALIQTYMVQTGILTQ